MTERKYERMLYGLIGGLSAAQTCVAANQIPSWLACPIAIALGVCIALKAKRSKGADQQREEDA